MNYSIKYPVLCLYLHYKELITNTETTIAQKRIVEEAVVHENVIFNSY